jgi:hypothetical protein
MPAKTAPKTAPAKTTGPKAETLAFAAKVVSLRDGTKTRPGLAWKAVAAKLGVNYDANGSSRLRRAYVVGNGKTNGVRAAKVATAPKAKRAAKAAPKTTRAAKTAAKA